MLKFLVTALSLLWLIGCAPQSGALNSVSIEITQDVNITQTADPDSLVLDELKKGDEFLAVCKQGEFYTVPAPTGAAVVTWTNQEDAGLGFIPAAAVKIRENPAPDCAGLLHGPDEHSKHTAPTT